MDRFNAAAIIFQIEETLGSMSLSWSWSWSSFIFLFNGWLNAEIDYSGEMKERNKIKKNPQRQMREREREREKRENDTGEEPCVTFSDPSPLSMDIHQMFLFLPAFIRLLSSSRLSSEPPGCPPPLPFRRP